MAKVKNFSILEKLTSLIRLQKSDSKMDSIEVLKGELPMEVQDLEDELEGLSARRNRIEEEINGMKEFIDQNKANIKEAEDLKVKYEKQSKEVKNNREFEAISKQIERQDLDMQLAAKYIKDTTYDIEKKAVKLDETSELIKSKEAHLQTKKAELDKIIKETEKEEKAVEELQGKAREEVDERLINSYDRIRNNYHNGLAVVPVERDACGGCFNAVPPQVQSEIRQHKKIIVCENCGRILIDKELFDSEEI